MPPKQRKDKSKGSIPSSQGQMTPVDKASQDKLAPSTSSHDCIVSSQPQIDQLTISGVWIRKDCYEHLLEENKQSLQDAALERDQLRGRELQLREIIDARERTIEVLRHENEQLRQEITQLRQQVQHQSEQIQQLTEQNQERTNKEILLLYVNAIQDANRIIGLESKIGSKYHRQLKKLRVDRNHLYIYQNEKPGLDDDPPETIDYKLLLLVAKIQQIPSRIKERFEAKYGSGFLEELKRILQEYCPETLPTISKEDQSSAQEYWQP
jgi:chromosome segregation ATPase